jgi:hypothetical protein
MVALQPEHQSGENAHNQNDWQTDRSLLVDCSGNPRQKPFGLRQGRKRPSSKKREIAHSKNNAERPPSKPMQHQAGNYTKTRILQLLTHLLWRQ